MAELRMGDRFKDYERVSDHYLTRRQPVIVRVDGRAFHTLTRTCKKPYDTHFAESMQFTAQALCEEMQGAKVHWKEGNEIRYGTIINRYGDPPSYTIRELTCNKLSSSYTDHFNIPEHKLHHS